MKRQILLLATLFALLWMVACASSETATDSTKHNGPPDGGMKSSTTVTVIGPGADADAPSKFDGVDDANAKPELVYPANGVVMPPNMRSLEVHFVPSGSQSLFEIRFESPNIALVYYVGCDPVGAGCVFQTDEAFWDQFVKQNMGLDPIQYRIRGVDTSAPASVGTSETHEMAFAWDNIAGGLYYWNSAGVIQRYEFGAPQQAPEQFMTPQMAGASACVGCHGVSRDGKKMVIGQDLAAPATYKLFDVATRTPLSNDGKAIGGTANFFSFSPDGSKLLFADSKIGLQDTTTGAIENPTVADPGTMPDWSPDGKLVVYAKPNGPPPAVEGDPTVSGASLELLSYDGKTFTPVRTLTSGANNYYPAISPDSAWVIFNRSPGSMDSYSSKPPDGDGELWAVDVNTTSPIRLENANTGGGSSWPKWVPDASKYYRGTIMWVTVSSARGYGLRSAKGEKVQLWMFGFDPNHSGDRSLPAFWFPYQDTTGSNHIAQWVTHVDRTPCSTTSDCAPAEECKDGYCYSTIK